MADRYVIIDSVSADLLSVPMTQRQDRGRARTGARPMTARTDPESFRDRDLHELHDWEAAMEPVGQKEIADRLGVTEATVQKWRTRKLLPGPEPSTVGGRPWWRWHVIEQWARDTNRLIA